MLNCKHCKPIHVRIRAFTKRWRSAKISNLDGDWILLPETIPQTHGLQTLFLLRLKGVLFCKHTGYSYHLFCKCQYHISSPPIVLNSNPIYFRPYQFNNSYCDHRLRKCWGFLTQLVKHSCAIVLWLGNSVRAFGVVMLLNMVTLFATESILQGNLDKYRRSSFNCEYLLYSGKFSLVQIFVYLAKKPTE